MNNLIILSDISKKTAADIAGTLLGTPYKYLGRDLLGLDCWGTVILFNKMAHYKVPDWTDYKENWQIEKRDVFMETFYKEYYKYWRKVEIPAVGDGVLFTNLEGMAIHAGIIIGENSFLHCPKAGVVISRFNSFWDKKFLDFYRLKARDK